MDKTYFSMTRVVLLLSFLCSAIFNQVSAATYTVSVGTNGSWSTADPNTFEWALAQCNLNTGPHTIAFTVATVTVQNPALMVLTRSGVTIDGTTMPGLVITGPNYGTDGFYWNGVSNVIMKGLTFNKVMVNINGGTGNSIINCRFNLDATGTASVSSDYPNTITATNSTNLTIGGSVANRNTFGWATTRLVNLTNCTTAIVSNNYMGSNIAGTAVVGTSGDYGIYINGGSGFTMNANTIIGCPNTGGAASTGSGIFITGATNSITITNNNLGVNASGIGGALGNNKSGVYVTTSSSNSINVSNNIVCSNGAGQTQANNSGLYFEVTGVVTTLTISNNKVGVDANFGSFGNDFAGIYLNCATASNFYPSVSITNNVVGNNGFNAAGKSHGIAFYHVGTAASPANVVITGNYVGITPAGADAGNAHNGIEVNGSSGFTIGGTTAALRNYVSYNKGINPPSAQFPIAAGIIVASSPNVTIIGNYIGCGINGTTNAGNSNAGASYKNSGVAVVGAASTNVVIGGVAANEGNIIAYNGRNGVLVSDGATTTTIRGNSIFCNGYRGISLNLNAALNNDENDTYVSGLTSTSGNGAYGNITSPGVYKEPLINSTTSTASEVHGSAPASSTVDIYAVSSTLCLRTCDLTAAPYKQQGARYISTVTATAAGAFDATGLTLPAGYSSYIVTATASNGRTSEFSTCYTPACVPPAAPTVNSPVVCQTGANGITLSVSNHVAGSTYTWTLGSGLTLATGSNGQTITVNAAIPAGANATYTFSVTATNAGCTSTAGTGSVTIYKSPSTPSLGSVSPVCSATTANLTATSPAVGTGVWSQTGGPASTITTPNSNNTSVTGLASGSPTNTYTYTYTITNGPTTACPATTGSVNVTVTTTPAVPTVNSPEVCQTAANGIGLSVSNATAGATFAWTMGSGLTQASGGTTSNITANATVPAGNSANYTFTVTSSLGGCTSAAGGGSVTIYKTPSTASVGSVSPVCSQTTANLTATSPTVGSGIWTQTAGPASTITSPNSNNTSVTGLASGSPTATYTYTYTVTNGPTSACPASTASVNVDVATTPIVSLNNDPLCENTSGLYTVTGTIPMGSTYTWTTTGWAGGSSTTASINLTAPDIAAANTANQNLSVSVLVSAGACSATASSTVQIDNNPLNAIAGNDESLCNATSYNLNATAPNIGTGIWSGGSPSTVTSPTIINSAVTGLSGGTSNNTYTYTWTVTNGVCPSKADDVTITVYAPVTANNTSVTICNATSTSVTADITPALANGTWTGAGLTFTPTDQVTTTVSGLTLGVNATVTYTVDNGGFGSSSACYAVASIAITNSTVAVSNPTTSTPNVCVTAPGTVTLSDGTVTGVWSVSSQPAGASASFSTTTAAPTDVTGLTVAGTYVFTWTISGTCGTDAGDVTVTVDAAPTATASDVNVCGIAGPVSLNGSGTGTWTTSSTIIIDNPSANNSTLSNLSYGQHTFTWSVANGTCTDTEDITVTLDEAVTATTTAFTPRCETDVTPVALDADPTQVGVWSVTSGTGTVVDVNDPSTSITGVTAGTITSVTWTVQSQYHVCANATSVVNVDIRVAPTANAGTDFSTCLTSTALDASDVNPGVWSVTAGTGTFTDNTNPNTVVSGLSVGVNTFTWTVSGGGVCLDATSDVDVTNTTADLNVSVVGDGDTLCVGSNRSANVTVVTSTGSGNYTYTWSDANHVLFTTTDPTASFTPGVGTTTYYVVVGDANQIGCNSAVASVDIVAVGEQNLTIPNLMTPNSDDLNDVLLILDENGKDILPGSYLQVVNRWGEQVFESNDYRNTWKAPNTSDGMYFYYLKAGCGGRVYKGWVHILGNNKP